MAAATYPTVLRERLGNAGCAALDEVIQVSQANLLTVDVFEQRLEQRLDRRFAEEFGKFRVEMSAEFAKLRGEIRGDIAESTAKLVKWTMMFWVGQAVAIASLIAALK